MNLDLNGFELSPEDMVKISALSRQNGRNSNQDPATYQEF